MHELSIVSYVVRQVEGIARENGASQVSSVTLEFGEVSGIVPQFIEDCWKWYMPKTELMRSARLVSETIPAVTQCQACGRQYETVRYGRTCPHCQSPDTYLVQGSEMMIKEIEAVEADDAAT